MPPPAAIIPAPWPNFEGLSNQDNFNIFGVPRQPARPGRRRRPEPLRRDGQPGLRRLRQAGQPAARARSTIGDALGGLRGPGLHRPLRRPDRALRPARRPLDPQPVHHARAPTYYNCVAISQTGDPDRRVLPLRLRDAADPDCQADFFPDYPKYGVWTDSYIMTTRDFGPTVEYGISVYALEKNKMINGNPNARAVQFFLDWNDPVPLAADRRRPAARRTSTARGSRRTTSPAPIVGTQDDDARLRRDLRRAEHLGADGEVERQPRPPRSTLAAQLPVAAFDSIFPCAPTSRDCLPQPGITNPAQYLDILSYRQRPTWRLAYRNFGNYEALVTNQSVEARARRRRRALVRDPPRPSGAYSRLPAGHLRPGRRRPSLDGQHRHGQAGQHGARLQRRQRRRRLPGHPLHRPPRRRPAGPDDAGRGHDHQRHAACSGRPTPAGATTPR